jgi:hypothetical protein
VGGKKKKDMLQENGKLSQKDDFLKDKKEWQA